MLLEVLDVLEKLEPDEGTPKDPLSIPKASKDVKDETNPSRYRTLSYDQFIAGRRQRTEKSQLTHNSLAGSEVSMVRGFLNRILGKPGGDEHSGDDDEEALKGYSTSVMRPLMPKRPWRPVKSSSAKRCHQWGRRSRSRTSTKSRAEKIYERANHRGNSRLW